MKWLIRSAIGLIGIIALAFGVGSLLPVEHSATVSRDISADLEAVWTAVTDLPAMPEWRTGLDAIERLPDANGLPSWTEMSGSEQLSFETVERAAPTLLVTKIVGEGLEFGGTWRVALEPASPGTRVSITEDGEVYNPLFRFVSRFIIGHDATMNRYLDDLEAYLAPV